MLPSESNGFFLSEPWNYWPSLVRDRVGQVLERERAHWAEKGKWLPKGFPAAEQHVADMERAFADLLRAMGYGQKMKNPAVETVGMGEESAP